jgi:hypothetical protein
MRIFKFYYLSLGKHANGHQFFLRAIINIFIKVIFPTMITYLERTFKEEKN